MKESGSEEEKEKQIYSIPDKYQYAMGVNPTNVPIFVYHSKDPFVRIFFHSFRFLLFDAFGIDFDSKIG